MPAYAIFHNRIHDLDGHQAYRKAGGHTVAQFGGRALASTNQVEILEGDPGFQRCTILEFPDMESARAWYRSEGYQAALPLRLTSSEGWVFLAEGLSIG